MVVTIVTWNAISGDRKQPKTPFRPLQKSFPKSLPWAESTHFLLFALWPLPACCCPFSSRWKLTYLPTKWGQEPQISRELDQWCLSSDRRVPLQSYVHPLCGGFVWKLHVCLYYESIWHISWISIFKCLKLKPYFLPFPTFRNSKTPILPFLILGVTMAMTEKNLQKFNQCCFNALWKNNALLQAHLVYPLVHRYDCRAGMASASCLSDKSVDYQENWEKKWQIHVKLYGHQRNQDVTLTIHISILMFTCIWGFWMPHLV